MKRGDIITIAWAGHFGKPRPAVVVQSDALKDNDTVLVCQITSMMQAVSIRRVNILPSDSNGLLKPSQLMVEKMFAVKRVKIGAVIGQLDQPSLIRLNEALALVIGLFDV